MTDCEEKEPCPRNTKILERLTKLEVSTEQSFMQISNNVALARDLVEKDRKETKDFIEGRFAATNQWQHRFDRLEGELVRKSELDKEVETARKFTDQALTIARDLTHVAEKAVSQRLADIGIRVSSVERMLYIGIGVILAIQFVLHYLK